MDFTSLPNGAFTLDNLTVPACLIGSEGGLVRHSLTIADGRFAKVAAAARIDMKGAMALPCFTDMHTHLDKGHIWPRAANPDGTFDGALETVGYDRAANWSAGDVRARMEFSLACGYAHGSRAIRTHLDSIPPQDEISWPVFCELRQKWQSRIDLQAVCLVGIDGIDTDGAFANTARIVADAGGILGTVTYPISDLRERLKIFFDLAEKHDLAVDLHVDETGDPGVATLKVIAETVLEREFSAPVVAGHCCSLAMQPDKQALATLDLVARAGINIVSLPMCNMYLQDRQARRTPRWRGITLVHEMRQRGIAVSFASDNTRDPFYAYGDLDMLEVVREATRIAHLDHSDEDWIRAFSATPAEICGFDIPGFLPGSRADLILFNAREWSELLARPQSDRIVLRNGIAIDRRLPEYAELDELVRR